MWRLITGDVVDNYGECGGSKFSTVKLIAHKRNLFCLVVSFQPARFCQKLTVDVHAVVVDFAESMYPNLCTICKLRRHSVREVHVYHLCQYRVSAVKGYAEKYSI